jgi:hypothetical protein
MLYEEIMDLYIVVVIIIVQIFADVSEELAASIFKVY